MGTPASSSGVAGVARCECGEIDTLLYLLPVRKLFLLHRTGEPLQVTHEHPVHAALGHAARGEGITVPGDTGAEEGTALDAGGLDVLGD